jgi:hypothetical protein
MHSSVRPSVRLCPPVLGKRYYTVYVMPQRKRIVKCPPAIIRKPRTVNSTALRPEISAAAVAAAAAAAAAAVLHSSSPRTPTKTCGVSYNARAQRSENERPMKDAVNGARRVSISHRRRSMQRHDWCNKAFSALAVLVISCSSCEEPASYLSGGRAIVLREI